MQLKNIIVTACVALTLCAFPLLAAERFQGMVTYQFKSDGDVTNVSFYVTGEKTKLVILDEEDEQSVIILDYENRKQTVIVESQKMAMVQAMPEAMYKSYANTFKENAAEYAEAMDKSALKATGKTKKMHGYNCSEFIFTDEDGNQGTIWNAEGLGTFAFGGGAQGGAINTQDLSKFNGVLGTDEFFPMEMSMKDDDGEFNSMLATKVKKGALDDSEFEVPAGYQVMDMGSGGMMQMMQNQMKNYGR